MAYTTIDDPTIYFNTKLYTGTGSSQSITGVGFQPDWVWTKQRNGTASHGLIDSVRGLDKYLSSEQTIAEYSLSNNGLSSFDSDGFTVVSHAMYNGNTNTYVAWNWLAGGSASSNSNGSVTSTVSANTTSGFSIVSYTGNGTNGATVGHGLGVTPDMMIIKNRSSGSAGWPVYHTSTGNSGCTFLNSNDAFGDYGGGGYLRNPSSSTFETYFTGSGGSVNVSSENFIAYCFAEKKGYSKFGSYTGNGNADGPFIYTGFKPAWVMAKRTGTSGQNWEIHDNKRPEYNSSSKRLWANLSNAEATEDPYLDLVSNGFKIKTSDTNYNASDSYIYMAFAESPFVNSNGVPNNAR